LKDEVKLSSLVDFSSLLGGGRVFAFGGLAKLSCPFGFGMQTEICEGLKGMYIKSCQVVTSPRSFPTHCRNERKMWH
jgi:hypothetical protein